MKQKPSVMAAFVIGLLGLASQAHAQFSSAFKSYRDPVHDVRFRYPAAWELSDGMNFYMGTNILNTAARPVNAIAAVGFYGGSGDGYRPYPHSNLSGIQFAFTVRESIGKVGCEHIAKGITDDHSGKQADRYETIHGVRYLHTFGGDGGAGHSVDSEIYAAYRGDTCYLFEQDIHTLASDVEPGEKPLSKDTVARLRAQLRDVMHSVTLSKTSDSMTR